MNREYELIGEQQLTIQNLQRDHDMAYALLESMTQSRDEWRKAERNLSARYYDQQKIVEILREENAELRERLEDIADLANH